MERDGLICRRRVMVAGVDYSDVKKNKSVVLDHIRNNYKKVLRRLPPELIPSLGEGGFCFGFLDPISNIIANTVSQEVGMRKGRKRSRDGNENRGGQSSNSESRRTAISKITAEKYSKNISLIPWATDHSDTILRNSSIAARSLRGLVNFLTSYFRYLTTWDALFYLKLSNADLLVAVHLIQEDRGTNNFTIHDPTAKMALGCAAIFALHPTSAVPTFVSRSFILATRVDEVSNLLETQGRISYSTVMSVSELFTSTKDDRKSGRRPMQYAITRLQHRKMKAVTRLQHRKMKNISVRAGLRAGLEISLKMVLLDRIHVLYLEAISRIPKHELCSRHHRGLLKAGHCYGPFDPVTNIILNAIWYDTMFPPKQHFEVEMICTKSLARTECLSLCGLVAYLHVRFPTLSVYEALRRLLICDARLDKLIKMAKKEGLVEGVSFSESVAYCAASHAAHHPSPTGHAEFTTTVMPQVEQTIWSIRDVKRVLSSRDVRTISETLSQILPPSKPLKKVQKLTKRSTEIISAHRDEFKYCQAAIVKMAEASLLRYEREGGQEYKLHFICDVNSTIPEYGVTCCRHSSSNYPFCHMNVWARRRGSQNDEAPTLFFIQCSTSDGDMQDMSFLCCPILDLSKDAGRCYHCEYEGTKIIHPPSANYLGHCLDFEDMARRTAVDTQRLVEHGQMRTLFDHTLEDEESIYFDPAWDVDFSVFINHTSKEQARGEKLMKLKDHSWIEKLVRESLFEAHS